jgi:hypothetical protein
MKQGIILKQQQQIQMKQQLREKATLKKNRITSLQTIARQFRPRQVHGLKKEHSVDISHVRAKTDPIPAWRFWAITTGADKIACCALN